jgi:hypothetical protein
MFEKGISQYEKLNSSKRLKLLNFLCDETLGTLVMRNCIDSQNIESVERKKEAKEKINAAKDKVTLKSNKSLQVNFENT